MSILTLKIEVCGNPDYGQDPSKPPFGVKRFHEIKAGRIEIIRILVMELQNELGRKCNFGGGNWKEAILYRDNEKVGRMSWNGRVWDKDGNEILF